MKLCYLDPGGTPLEYAAWAGWRDVAQLLLDHNGSRLGTGYGEGAVHHDGKMIIQ